MTPMCHALRHPLVNSLHGIRVVTVAMHSEMRVERAIDLMALSSVLGLMQIKASSWLVSSIV